MTVYTTLPTDDLNLAVEVTEAADLVELNITPAIVYASGGGVTSVNGASGVVTLDTDDIPEGTTNLYSDQPNAITDDVTFNSVTADMFGVQHFVAKARETITAGQPVYISGHSGNTPEVMVADFDDPTKMPAFGIASADIQNNNNGSISTYGDLKNVDTTGTTEGETWAVGDELFVNGSKLTNVRPTSSTEEVQKIAKIIRVHANTGQMFLMGAGRSNDTPNLAHYNVFIGNAGGVEARQLDYTTDILNTPTIPTNNNQLTNGAGYITADSTDTLSNKSGNISQWTNDAGYITSETDNQTLSFADPVLTISGSLSTVDLSALNTTTLAWSAITSTPTTIAGYGITDAFSGAYADLTGKPTIPTNNNQLTNGAAYITASSTDTLTNKGGSNSQWTNDEAYIKADTTDTLSNKTLTDPFIDNRYTTDKFNYYTQYTNPSWSIYNTHYQIANWKDNGNNVVNRQRVQTPNGHAFFQYDVIGSADDGTHNVDMFIKGDSNQIKSSTNTGADAPLLIDGSNINFFGEYAFPLSDGTANQVLQTDGNGTLTFATVSGGGGGTLAGLSDVSITSVQNNDLLMYNGTASEWQNTNLGLTVTPTLTGDSSAIGGGNYTLTVSNHAIYDDPAYFVEVYTGSTKVVDNDDVTNNGDGTFNFTAPAIGSHEIRVRAQDFGDLQSEIATKALTTTAFGGNFRYWKLTGVTCNQPNWWMLANMRLFDATGQGGNAYPANMTSDTTPTPYVTDTNNVYNASYPAWKAFDSNTVNSFYWAIGSTNGPADWLTVDLGSAYDIKSMTITAGNNAQYAPTGFELYASATGVFGGEETLIYTATGLPNVAGQVTNIG